MATSSGPSFNPPNPQEYGGDEVNAIVLDPGYDTTRAGFAGEDVPKSVVPTYYGAYTSDAIGSSNGSTNGSHPRSILLGENALHDPKPYIDIRNPLTPDDAEEWVQDWDVAGRLWEYAVTNRLTGPRTTKTIRTAEDGAEDVAMEDVDDAEAGPLSENPLLMSEPGKATGKARERVMELVMESWGCPAFYLAKSGVLSSFSAGKSTALVIDVGAARTTVTPVIDGITLRKGTKSSPLAGNYISNQVRLMFASQDPLVPLIPHYMVSAKAPVDAGQPSQATYKKYDVPPTASFRRWEEDRVLTEFKESVVQVWEGPGRLSAGAPPNEEVANKQPARPFEMPDGWNQVFGVERFKTVEGLFDENGAYVDDDNPRPRTEQTIPSLVNSALMAVDADSRPNLLNNLLLVGGTSLIQGFARRLESEINALYPSPKVRLQAPAMTVERKFATWIGGSILASLGSFHQLWISKKEYDEHGPGIVEKRCK